MTTYTKAYEAAAAGRNDSDMSAIGEFSVFEMPDGSYDYFPAGQPANVAGEVVKSKKVATYWFNPSRQEWLSVY